jgi:hypothetical protein
MAGGIAARTEDRCRFALLVGRRVVFSLPEGNPDGTVETSPIRRMTRRLLEAGAKLADGTGDAGPGIRVCLREIDRVEYDSQQEPGGWVLRIIGRSAGPPDDLHLPRWVSAREHSGDADGIHADPGEISVL